MARKINKIIYIFLSLSLSLQACQREGVRFSEGPPSEFEVSIRELLRNGSSYVAYLEEGAESAQCLDVMAEDVEIDVVVGNLVSKSNDPLAEGLVEMKLRRDDSIKIYPGSYYVLDGIEILSSSPYYFKGDEQIFLHCSVGDGSREVFAVLSASRTGAFCQRSAAGEVRGC